MILDLNLDYVLYVVVERGRLLLKLWWLGGNMLAFKAADRNISRSRSKTVDVRL